MAIKMHDHTHCTHHEPAHSHEIKNYNRAFAYGITLNLIFVIVETIYGFLANSLALMADAGHNLSDVAGLMMAWGAVWLSQKKPTIHYTFGLRKTSIFSAFFNSIFLLMAVGIILWESIHRLLSPHLVDTKMVITVAGIGIVINSLTALLFLKDKNDDLNIRGAYLHMAADALISLGVVVSAVVISYTSWYWLDQVVSILISFIIIYGTWDLLKTSTRLSLDAVPEKIDPEAVKNYFITIPEVREVHDLHIWAMSTTETALSVHLTVNSNIIDNNRLVKIANYLKSHFNIHHPTIQIEVYEKNFECHLSPEDVF